jgi:invasion protein IalB
MMQITRGFLIAVCALALAACASKPAANSAAPAAANAGTPAASPVPKGYRRVVKGGTEYFCRTQGVTGSHTLKNEVCLTRDELAAERNHTTTFGSDPRATANATPR